MAKNRALFQYEMAPQSGKGIPAAAPEFFLKAIGGALSPKRTTGQTLTGDGTVFSDGFEYVAGIDAGGSLQVAGQPIAIGALVDAVFGTDTKTGGGDPYSHALVPNQASGGTTWYTFWKRVDDYWELYPDAKVTELLIEASVDKRLMQATATIMSGAATQCITAPSSASAETEAFIWSNATGSWGQDSTYTNFVTSPKAVDLPTAIVLANALKAAYNLHCAVATGYHHKAADATNTVGAVDADDLAKLETLLNEMKGDVNAHRINTTVHYHTDTDHIVASADATTLATALVLANEIKEDYNKHAGYIGSIREFSMRITRGFEAWQGDGITPYDIVEGHGDIEVSFTVLLDVEGLRFYKHLMYGTPEPATGTEVDDEILNGSFYAKFNTGATPERSISFLVPILRYKADDIGDAVAGDTSGAAGAMTITGVARGADPKCTITVLNSRSTAY